MTAPAGTVEERCAFCKRQFADGEDQLLVMRDGAVIGRYHEACRPDRRKSGCAGC